MAIEYKLFDIIKIMFTDVEKWKDISDKDKAANFFMINRFMSINFPMQAQVLNKNKINPVVVVNMWQQLGARHKKIPGWIYTKTDKTKKNEKSHKVDNELRRFYIEKNGIKESDFDFLLELYPDEIKSYLKQLEKQIHVSNEC